MKCRVPVKRKTYVRLQGFTGLPRAICFKEKISNSNAVSGMVKLKIHFAELNEAFIIIDNESYM